MATTAIERNKRRSDLRWQGRFALRDSVNSAICELWLRAQKEQMTHADMLKYRNDWIFGERWQHVPDWIKENADGAWNALQYVAYRQSLVFCYAHPATGVMTDSKALCNAGLASQLDTTTGAHCWTNADGSIGRKFN